MHGMPTFFTSFIQSKGYLPPEKLLCAENANKTTFLKQSKQNK